MQTIQELLVNFWAEHPEFQKMDNFAVSSIFAQLQKDNSEEQVDCIVNMKDGVLVVYDKDKVGRYRHSQPVPQKYRIVLPKQ